MFHCSVRPVSQFLLVMSLEGEVSRERSPRSLGTGSRTKPPNWKGYKCFAVGVAYSGDEYFGFQWQPGDTPTVERDIQKALVDARFLAPEYLTDQFKEYLYWSRAARTDRGVHAAMNVVACRLDDTQIKKSGADAPSVGSPMALDQEDFVARLNAHLPPQIRALFVNRVTMRFDARVHCDRRRYEYYLPSVIGDRTIDIDTLRAQLLHYKGTHNFHNFTKGMHVNDKSAFRHIQDIDVSDIGAKFLVVSLLGQSFLLNQIRKMVSLALEVTLGLAPGDAIQEALTSKSLVHTHMVPGEGLLLDRMSYKAYDTHKCGDYTITTPFSWLIGSEEEPELGNAWVLEHWAKSKQSLVAEHVLPKLAPLFDFWLNEVVIPNDWVKRHLPVEEEEVVS